MHMKVTMWFKSFEGLKNSLFGFVIQYNFLRTHTALSVMTLAKKAGLKYKLRVVLEDQARFRRAEYDQWDMTTSCRSIIVSNLMALFLESIMGRNEK